MPRLGDIIDALDGWFDPRWAESWDAVGLVCGDPDETVERVLLAVDAVPATVEECITAGASLLLTHHPLLLAAVHGVPADDVRGRLVHRMIRAGVAHFVAHTNADVAVPGVSDALAGALGVRDVRPLQPQDDVGLDKLVVYVPVERAAQLIDTLAAAGAGRFGDYDRCAWTVTGTGTFRPLAGARPALGSVGDVTEVVETRVEMLVARSHTAPAVAALRAVHPYEEPAFDVVPLAAMPSRRGLGRIGTLAAPTTLAAFTAAVAAALPATGAGVRAAGDPAATIATVAVCGGSGGSLIEDARRAGADAYVTADLKHHPTLDATVGTDGGTGGGSGGSGGSGGASGGSLALLDAGHWATEAPWLDAVAGALRDRFGTTLEALVSRRVTDPWTLHVASPPPSPVNRSASRQ